MAQDGEQAAVDRGDVLPAAVADDNGIIDPAPTEEVVETAAKAPEKTPEPAEATPDKDEKGKFIPRERFNEAVSKERQKVEAANARAAELEGQLAAQVTSQDIQEAQKTVKELIKQRNSHLGDGELDKAGEIDEKIFEIQGAIADRKAEIKAEQSRAAAVESMKYDAVVERLEATYPQINPDNDSYDEEAVTEIRALMKGYQVEMRLSPAVALARAAKRVFGEAKPAEKEDKSAEEGLRRKAEATERNVDAAKKQPVSTKDVGLDHDKKGGGLDSKTVMNMKQDEFAKLGEDVLSRLRGDTL